MTEPSTLRDPAAGLSICLFCGSSDAASPSFLAAARNLGDKLASEDVRLVYGGGGVGLMGAAAKAANARGGKVLGVIPEFLRRAEVIYDAVETVTVPDMHTRKRIMFEQSDAFVVLPGGIGTLEEVVELLSWRRLNLHEKPIVFLNVEGFWEPFFTLIRHTTRSGLSPAWIDSTWIAVDTVDQVIPSVRHALAGAPVQVPVNIAARS